MEVDKAILERRSIRKYLNKPVENEKLAKIVDVCRFAPSAGNCQNWKIIVVTDDKKKKELAGAALDQHWMNEAPVLLVICNEFKKVSKLYGKLGKMFSIQNCAVLASDITLMATSLGLSTCWVGAFNNETIKRVLKIPEDVDPETIIALGYAGEEKLEESKRYASGLITFFNSWGKKTGSLPKPKSITETVKDKVKGLIGK